MLTQYIHAAMRQAKYEILAEDGSFYGHIPPCPGVWANADTLEGCREELQEVLEEWILLGLHLGDPLPVVEGIDLNQKEPADALNWADWPQEPDPLSAGVGV